MEVYLLGCTYLLEVIDNNGTAFPNPYTHMLAYRGRDYNIGMLLHTKLLTHVKLHGGPSKLVIQTVHCNIQNAKLM